MTNGFISPCCAVLLFKCVLYRLMQRIWWTSWCTGSRSTPQVWVGHSCLEIRLSTAWRFPWCSCALWISWQRAGQNRRRNIENWVTGVSHRYCSTYRWVNTVSLVKPLVFVSYSIPVIHNVLKLYTVIWVSFLSVLSFHHYFDSCYFKNTPNMQILVVKDLHISGVDSFFVSVCSSILKKTNSFLLDEM